VFEDHTREEVDDVLISRYIKDYGMDSLQIAVECECEKFVSSPLVQNNLTNLWRGPRKIEIELVGVENLWFKNCNFINELLLKTQREKEFKIRQNLCNNEDKYM